MLTCRMGRQLGAHLALTALGDREKIKEQTLPRQVWTCHPQNDKHAVSKTSSTAYNF